MEQREKAASARLVAFFDLLAGAGHGAALLHRVEADAEPLGGLLDEVSRSEAFGDAFKRNRVNDFGVEGFLPPHGTLLGLPDEVDTMPFATAFATHYAPRLKHRGEAFGALFAALAEVPGAPLVLETGTLRVPGNWEGDGQSTYLFDHFVRERNGRVFSIDVNIESVETARRVCSGCTSLICNDSVMALQTLAGLLRGRAALLYLDSFDLDRSNPGPSAAHHAMELAAAMPLLGPGSLVAVDDYAVPGTTGGKGAIVDGYMASTRAEVIYSGYQKIWRIR